MAVLLIRKQKMNDLPKRGDAAFESARLDLSTITDVALRRDLLIDLFESISLGINQTLRLLSQGHERPAVAVFSQAIPLIRDGAAEMRRIELAMTARDGMAAAARDYQAARPAPRGRVAA